MAAYHLTIYARAIHTTCPASCIAAAYSRCRTSDRLVPVRYQLPCSQPPSCARARFSRPSIAIASPIPWFDRYIPISPKDRTIDREPGRRFVAAEEFPHLPSEIASFSAYAKQRDRERERYVRHLKRGNVETSLRSTFQACPWSNSVRIDRVSRCQVRSTLYLCSRFVNLNSRGNRLSRCGQPPQVSSSTVFGAWTGFPAAFPPSRFPKFYRVYRYGLW